MSLMNNRLEELAQRLDSEADKATCRGASLLIENLRLEAKRERMRARAHKRRRAVPTFDQVPLDAATIGAIGPVNPRAGTLRLDAQGVCWRSDGRQWVEMPAAEVERLAAAELAKQARDITRGMPAVSWDEPALPTPLALLREVERKVAADVDAFAAASGKALFAGQAEYDALPRKDEVDAPSAVVWVKPSPPA